MNQFQQMIAWNICIYEYWKPILKELESWKKLTSLRIDEYAVQASLLRFAFREVIFTPKYISEYIGV